MGDVLPEIPGYDVEAGLGRGGMGVVYRARHRETGAVRALKKMLAGRGASFAELTRFRIEAEALACLNHPNIVKIRDVGLLDGYPYFAMDFAGLGESSGEGWDAPDDVAETTMHATPPQTTRAAPRARTRR